jgi:hypothetical protein
MRLPGGFSRGWPQAIAQALVRSSIAASGASSERPRSVSSFSVDFSIRSPLASHGASWTRVARSKMVTISLA